LSLWSTYLPAFTLALGLGMALPAIPPLARSFDVSFGLASLVISSFLLGGLAGSLPTGALIDRFGLRAVMLVGPILTSAMALLVFRAQTFPELLIYRFIDGWAAQMWLLGRISAISARSANRDRGRKVTWMLSMDGTGRLVGPVLGGLIASEWGPRSPFAAYAVLALIAVLPNVLIPREVFGEGAGKPVSTGPRPKWRNLVRPLVGPRLVFFGVAFFSAMARGPVFSDLLHLYAAFTYNLDARAIGFLATATGSVSVPIGFFAGYSLDRFGRRHTLLPAFAGITLTMLGLAGTAFLHLSLFWYVGTFLGGVALQGLTNGSTQTIGADVAPPDNRGTFLGMWQFVNITGTACSPLLFAFIADRAGYGPSFIFVAATAFLVVVLLSRMPEPSTISRGDL
ncbi:MAG: MFS transporter, partial [Chloroflexi bacterium]|nr:MFS transporter [Chloroflexota bacterium]